MTYLVIKKMKNTFMGACRDNEKMSKEKLS